MERERERRKYGASDSVTSVRSQEARLINELGKLTRTVAYRYSSNLREERVDALVCPTITKVTIGYGNMLSIC